MNLVIAKVSRSKDATLCPFADWACRLGRHGDFFREDTTSREWPPGARSASRAAHHALLTTPNVAKESHPCDRSRQVAHGSIQYRWIQLSRSDGQSHCMLVCVDKLTKWLKVIPLKRHDSASISTVFTTLCMKFGLPAVICCDSGTEFESTVVDALFHMVGIRVQHGAVRHPQSQGGAEHANRTLLSLLSKTIDEPDDWKSALETLVYNSRILPD